MYIHGFILLVSIYCSKEVPLKFISFALISSSERTVISSCYLLHEHRGSWGHFNLQNSRLTEPTPSSHSVDGNTAPLRCNFIDPLLDKGSHSSFSSMDHSIRQ